MTAIYTTRQGETVDMACWKHYGRTAGVTEAVLAANTGLASLPAILPMGTIMFMPVFEQKQSAAALVSLWD